MDTPEIPLNSWRNATLPVPASPAAGSGDAAIIAAFRTAAKVNISTAA